MNDVEQNGSRQRYRLGVDIGGTFTDAVLFSEEGGVQSFKVPSTPGDLARGFLAAVDRALEQGLPSAGDLGYLAHATTAATNAIIEGKTARTALVVTRGFRDLLEIARQTRPSLYDLFADKLEPLVPRDRCFEVSERLDAAGRVLAPLDESDLERVAGALTAAAVESVAVCFLHAYRFPEHERRAAAFLAQRLPGVLVSASSAVWPEFREYLRASTTVVNAAIRPTVSRYLDRVSAGLAERGVTPNVQVMQSNGGVCSATLAREAPVNILESGPAAGIAAAVHFGALTGFSNLLSFDMGGTTAKAALIRDGRPRLATDFEVGSRAAAGRGVTRGYGYPIQTPVLDLVEVGAGGGSIAWVDSAGVMHIGPHSAGAVPGPACYGAGGEEPTVTDANLVLGRLNPAAFLGGEMPLDGDAAWRAIERRCARPSGLDRVAAAYGILALANASMIGALRLISVQRGYDPRDFALLAFGGAGPLHANALAEALNIPTTIVPPLAGVASAFGLLAADIQHEHVVTHVVRLTGVDIAELNATFDHFEAEGRARLTQQGLAPADIAMQRYLDLRYVRQSYELRVPVPSGALAAGDLPGIAEAFHAEHARSYGYAAPEEPVELVNVRLTAVGRVAKPQLPAAPAGGPAADTALLGERPVYFGGRGFTPTSRYDRTLLLAGMRIAGPAIIEQPDSTTVIQPGYQAVVEPHGHLLIRR